MRISLTGGAYVARALSAGAQRCCNLIPEVVPDAQGEPASVIHYPTPGLLQVAIFAEGSGIRGLYRASSGTLFAAAGTGLYRIAPDWTVTGLYNIAFGPTGVSMADNGTTMLVVDGTAAGYAVDLATNAVTPVSSPGFYGSSRVDYLDTYFVCAKADTQQFYVSDSLSTTFDPLSFASKVTAPDHIVAAVALDASLWLLGDRTTEVWTDSGSSDFPFQRMPGAFIEHGCASGGSIAKLASNLFWLSQSPQGRLVAVRGSGYQAQRISNHAVEAEWATYAQADDVTGWCYAAEGHAFYCLLFRSAGKTWCCDLSTGLWHERSWWDAAAGAERAHRGAFAVNCYGKTVVGDRDTPALYVMSQAYQTDNGTPIRRTRGFPHMSRDGARVFYDRFTADMQVDPGVSGDLSLRWSDDRGASWGAPVTLPLGGAANTSLQWRRLGFGRDRLWEIQWSAPARTALLGAYVDARVAGS